ncbi:TetR/AcrR family transcriptional regulator [Aliarcobacter butzleri]|uniref:TetR/AcrR family transcriptional regulator n=1 Tax=Aliarcobacter butzleri TaxID=28197 RepID=UPI0028CB368B|nr:TetR/AcrR family transcriptional regulator [Aliarcobacter butzleri]
MSSSKENKKNTIIENALKLFSQKGFYNTTIPDIAKAMQMSVGNMYNYFASKEELAKFAIKYSTNILADELRKINNLDISSKEKIWLN